MALAIPFCPALNIGRCPRIDSYIPFYLLRFNACDAQKVHFGVAPAAVDQNRVLLSANTRARACLITRVKSTVQSLFTVLIQKRENRIALTARHAATEGIGSERGRVTNS